jgi:CheY-like chemotaxis protein
MKIAFGVVPIELSMTTALKATVLLVEDDEEFRGMLTEVLSEVAGCRVIQAENGARALEILNALTPDLILTDVFMPEMDGWTLLGSLRRVPHLAAIPCVVLTGVADRVESTLPPTRMLSKPIRLPDLLSILDTIESSTPR